MQNATLIAGAIVRWALLATLYLAFAGHLGRAEIIAGLLSGLFAAALAVALTAMAERRFSLWAPWHRIVPRLAWALVRDSALVAAALGRAVVGGHAGAIMQQPFRPAGDDSAGNGRRALAILFASLAPNGYVVEEVTDRFAMHRLAPTPPADDPVWTV